MRFRSIGLSLMLLFFLQGMAQQRVLTQRELFDVVRRYHPIAQQAALNIEYARAEMLSARGAFDPVVETYHSRKELDGLLYYNRSTYELRIPTWYGVDIQTGVETLKGDKTNPEETKGASSYIGISVPVVKNMLMDRRRAAFRQAAIYSDLSEAEQQATINNLLQDASRTYWEWWEQYAVYQLFTAAIRNASERVRMVKTAYELGDRPAIDTLEALTQLQYFRLRQSELSMQLTNARLELSVFLWREDNAPYDLPTDVVPEQQTLVVAEALQSLDTLLQAAINHPELQQYEFKLDALQIERQLKFQSLLPSVYLKYNQLSNTHNLSKTLTTPWLDNNYRYGVSVSVPLRFSEGRGEYRKANIKITQTRLDQINKRIIVLNKVQQYYNEWRQLQQQVLLQQQQVTMLLTLQRGEEVKFFNGESSLFLINSREAKTLEAQQKLVELQSKYGKAVNSVLWAAGLLRL